MLGITVVPCLDTHGRPVAAITIEGSLDDQTIVADADGVEMAFDGLALVDCRVADAQG